MPYRLRLSGPPDAYIDEPYNPPTYPVQLEAAGFELVRSYASHDFDRDDVAALADNTVAQRAAVAQQGYRLEPLTPELWLERAGEMLTVGNEAFASNFAFELMTRAEFDNQFGERWARRLHPGLSLVAFDVADRVAGVAFVYPHYAPLAAQGAGSGRVAARDLNYAEHGSSNTEVVFKTAGVASPHRRNGLGWAISGEVAHRAREAGVTRLYMGPMREDNPSMNAVRHGWRQQRWYGLYARDLP
jgi:GNAT superfamily N-acetyltransferase